MFEMYAMDKNGRFYPTIKFMFYTRKQAEKEYRLKFNLKGKHLRFF